MRVSLLIRAIVSAVVLAAVLHVGARRTGPAPPLGRFLDPWSGVWAVAAVAEPDEQDVAELPGLSGPTEVVYDDRGVPHIFAPSREDAARALGYVVARDRLFQLETRWRSAAGRMSELVGRDAVDLDRRMRRLGLAWSAERDFAAMDASAPVAREAAAYAEGVNAWIDGLGRREDPLEYRLLGAEPSRWEPVYSLYMLKLMGWDLTYFNLDYNRARVAALVGWEAARALWPVNSPIQQPIQPNGQPGPRFDFAEIPPPGPPDLAAAQLARDLELALGPLIGDPENSSGPDPEPTALGSNNWAVAPERTAAGHALLAGDPHLGLSLPAIWYEAHMVVPGELDVYGVTLPSVPFIVIGFNRDVAWSFTNTGADVIDFYREQLDSVRPPTRYRVDGEWRDLEQRVEEIKGRRGRLLTIDTLYFTHRGPLVSRDDRWLSMRWTVLESSSETEALRNTNDATSVEGWMQAMESFTAPAQNGIVADRAGTIAIRSTGHYPLRPDGDGATVKDGSSSDADWTGFWPLDRYPFAIRPEQGYLASANQQPIDPLVDPTYLGSNWASPWRAIRINQLLAEDSRVKPDDMRLYHTDPGNARADFFMPYLLAAVDRGSAGAVSDRAREAASLLAEWDRRYTKENKRAVLFEYAMAEVDRRIWDELTFRTEGVRPQRRVFTPSSTVLASLMQQPNNAWWDDRRTPEVLEDRDAILVSSLASALDRVEEDHGDRQGGGWRWSAIRQANIYHVLGIPSLSALRLPVQGGSGNLNPSSGGGTHGASWRMVVELGPEVRAWTVYPGGQSGNPVSPFYTDRIDKWVSGELDPVSFPRSAADLHPGQVLSVLQLVPER